MGSIRSLMRRSYLEKNALSGIHLEISEGEIVGLIGANGAGKTTLIKILTGIIHPSGGHAEVLGYTPWKRHPLFRKQIALIMGQKAQLWWDLPAADCFILLREIYQIPKAEFQKKLDHLVDRLEVRGQLKVQIRKLSLGERMKFELIAALLHRPKVIYLDEPTIGLDLGSQKSIRQFIREYQEQEKPAVILTSHYIEDIQQLCKRIVILRQGEILYDGPIGEIVKHYSTKKIIEAQVGDFVRIPEDLGEVLESTPNQIKLRVERGRLSEAVSLIASQTEISDLTIEDQDVAELIEKLQHKGTLQ